MEDNNREIILTNRERMLLSQFPEAISREEIIANYNFSSEDLELIMIRRRDHNKLGFALQLGILRHTGKTFNSFDKIPEIIVTYVSMKLEIDEAIFPMYYDRENTILEHLDEIRKYYGYINFEDKHIAIIEKLVSTLILKSENPVYLIRQSMLVLKRDKIIIPRITTLEKMVGKSIIKNDERIFHQISCSLSDKQKKQIVSSLLTGSDSDVEIVGDVINSCYGGQCEKFLKILSDYGFTHTIDKESPDNETITHYIVYDLSCIKIIDKEKIKL